MNYNHELYHYGVPGMKWGVRRKGRNESGSAKPSKKTADKRITSESIKKAAIKGSRVVSKLYMTSLIDDVFWGGAGKKTIKAAGRAATDVRLKKHGHTNINWSN